MWWSIQSQKLREGSWIARPELWNRAIHPQRATTAVPSVAKVALGLASKKRKEEKSFWSKWERAKLPPLPRQPPDPFLLQLLGFTQQECWAITLILYLDLMMVGDGPVETGSSQNSPSPGAKANGGDTTGGAGSDWHFWFGPYPEEQRKSFDSWETPWHTDQEDSVWEKNYPVLPRTAISQSVSSSAKGFFWLCFSDSAILDD